MRRQSTVGGALEMFSLPLPLPGGLQVTRVTWLTTGMASDVKIPWVAWWGLLDTVVCVAAASLLLGSGCTVRGVR